MSLADMDRGAADQPVLRKPPRTWQIRSDVYCIFTSSRKWSYKETKETRPSVIYRPISGLFYRPAESDWKEKKGTSLSISGIKDRSANANLQGAYPPVIVHRVSSRDTVSVCDELGILWCVCVYACSVILCFRHVHVPSCVSFCPVRLQGKIRGCTLICVCRC